MTNLQVLGEVMKAGVDILVEAKDYESLKTLLIKLKNKRLAYEDALAVVNDLGSYTIMRAAQLRAEQDGVEIKTDDDKARWLGIVVVELLAENGKVDDELSPEDKKVLDAVLEQANGYHSDSERPVLQS